MTKNKVDTTAISNDTNQQLQKTKNALNISYRRAACDWSLDDKRAVFQLIIQDYCASSLTETAIAQYDLEKILKNADLAQKYTWLSAEVAAFYEKLSLIDEMSRKIDYGTMGDECLNDQAIWFGEDNDLLIIGESPARNGWLKSGLAWHDVNNKVLASGRVMQRLLEPLNRQLLSVTFLEAVQCYPVDRKYLGALGELYKEILIERLKVLAPKTILTMGDAPTRLLLPHKYQRLSDVVGQKFELNGAILIPIYHPSPQSPLSYKGNQPIFEKIAKLNERTI